MNSSLAARRLGVLLHRAIFAKTAAPRHDPIGRLTHDIECNRGRGEGMFAGKSAGPYRCPFSLLTDFACACKNADAFAIEGCVR